MMPPSLHLGRLLRRKQKQALVRTCSKSDTWTLWMGVQISKAIVENSKAVHQKTKNRTSNLITGYLTRENEVTLKGHLHCDVYLLQHC